MWEKVKGVGWGQAKEPASQCVRKLPFSNLPFSFSPIIPFPNLHSYARIAETMMEDATSIFAHVWEEASMDQYQSRRKLLTNFQGHWSIQDFPENKVPSDWHIRIPP